MTKALKTLSTKLYKRLTYVDSGIVTLSINQIYIAQRCGLQCSYAESKRNVLRRILNVLTDGAVRQFSGRELQSVEVTQKCRFQIHVPVT